MRTGLVLEGGVHGIYIAGVLGVLWNIGSGLTA